WTGLDRNINAVANAGKKIILDIQQGGGGFTATGGNGNIPDWVIDKVQAAGGTFFSFLDSSLGQGAGTVRAIPVFWDPTFLTEKARLYADLGAKYRDNVKVQAVRVSFAIARTDDWNVPASSSL